jgi:uncharacterized protein YndB with AHSA1/START domain
MLLKEFHGKASAIIDASPTVVFRALTEVHHLPEWNKRIARVTRPPETPLGDDIEWTVQMSVPPAKWQSRSRVVNYDPEGLVFEHTSHSDDGNPSYVLWHWTVSADRAGACVTVEWACYPKTFWRQFLFARQRRRQLLAEVPASLDALAYHLAPAETAS